MTQQRLIDYHDRDENSRCILGERCLFAVSTLPLSVWLPDLISGDPWARTAGVITVQTTSDHLQARTGSNYNVIDVTRDPKV